MTSDTNSIDCSIEQWSSDDWEFFMWGRETATSLDFCLAIRPHDDSRFLRIFQNLKGESRECGCATGLHTTVWEAAIALHLYIISKEEELPGFWCGKRVLELGAGTGLVGLTLAAFGAHVCLTELPVALDILDHNIRQNESVLNRPQTDEESHSVAKALPLEWGTEMSAELQCMQPFDFVVGSDIMYDETLFAPLIFSIDQVCTPGVSTLLLCRLKRGSDTSKMDRFYKSLRDDHGFTVDKILESESIRVCSSDADTNADGVSYKEIFRRFYVLSDQSLPFELYQATR